MKPRKPLTRTEVTGLVLLALIIIVIVGSAVLLRNCRGAESSAEPAPPAVEIISQEAGASAPSKQNSEKKARKKDDKAQKGKGRKDKAKKTKAQKEKRMAPARNPFQDTVPKF